MYTHIHEHIYIHTDELHDTSRISLFHILLMTSIRCRSVNSCCPDELKIDRGEHHCDGTAHERYVQRALSSLCRGPSKAQRLFYGRQGVERSVLSAHAWVIRMG